MSRSKPLIALATAALAALALAALAFAARADAYIFWGTSPLSVDDTIGRASVDGSNVNQSLIAGSFGVSPYFPNQLAANDEYVYWANFGTNQISRARHDGSGLTAGLITSQNVRAVAVDDTHIYWGRFNGGSYAIARANLDGTGIDPTFIDGLAEPNSIVVDEEHIFWTNGTQIGRANVDGSNANQSLISGLGVFAVSGLAVNGDHLYWGQSTPAGASIGRAGTDGSNVNQTFIDPLDSVGASPPTTATSTGPSGLTARSAGPTSTAAT